MLATVWTPIIAAAVAVGTSFQARKLWLGGYPSGEINSKSGSATGSEISSRIARTYFASAIGVSSGALSAFCISIATSIGHSWIGDTFGVLAILFIVSTVALGAACSAIYFSGQPERLVPPQMRKS